MLILDDSNSMDYDFVYPNLSPGLWQVPFALLERDTYPENEDGKRMDKIDAEGYAYCAWNVNRLYYNPNLRYLPPKKADGTFKPNIAFSSIGVAEYPCKNANNKPRIRTYAPPDGQPTNYQMPGHFTFTDIGPAGSFPKTAKRTDCTTNPCTLAEEQQNYANWFRYYRLRVYMATTALSHAIVEAPESLRFGWTRMSLAGRTTTFAINSGVSALGPLGSAKRVSFHAWLDSITPATTEQGTPAKRALDRVGKYFTRIDSDGPWGSTPRATSTSITSPAAAEVESEESPNLHASCRRSSALMVTDGRYTDGKQSAEVIRSNLDGSTTLPSIQAPNGSIYKYEPKSPYSDAYANTMADIAMNYWVYDLRTIPNIPNNVTPIKGTQEDPAFWQHLNFSAITMGLQGSFALTAANMNAIKNGTLKWPDPAPVDRTAVDDLLHATINGRGSFINANDTEELTDSIKSMVSIVLRASATQGGVAVSTVNLVAGTKKFVPVYTSGQWTGNLIANLLDAKTGREIKKLWEVEITNPNTGDEWANALGAYATRNIFTGTKPGAAAKAVAFTYPAMNSAGLTALMSAEVNAAAIDYLRGNRALEAGDDPTYRKRRFLLGDIVNSNPTVVGPAIDYGYGKLPSATQSASYANYLNAKRARGEGLVFIGANDGMLHAFRESDGVEAFAYVPHAVLPQIHLLTRPDYSHRYFVDGPTSQGDFYDTVTNKWRTVLIATAGAGAKSVFAIDATSNTLNASSVLWEVHSGMTPTFELGNILSEAHVGQLINGKWVAVFGNGVHSKSGKAQLVVVDAKTGALVQMVDTGVAGGNGLGGVRLVLNASNQIVGVYAGDLKGNLWRFDLTPSEATPWKAQALFAARDGAKQAMTAAPLAVPYPEGGMIVVAGTGRFFDAADPATTDIQTVYGIRDKNEFGSTPATITTLTGTSTLVGQTIQAKAGVASTVIAFDDTTSTQTVTYYEVSVNTIDWTVKDGWYFNQPFLGQRVVYPVMSVTGKVAKVDTIVPNNVSSDPCMAASPGAAYNYLIDVLAGGSPEGPILDTNGDGVVNSSDTPASGYSTGLDGRDVVLRGEGSPGPRCPPDTIEFITLDSSGGSTITCIPQKYGKKFVTKRAWQQLFLR